MTLFWLGFGLVALVIGLVYLMWDVRFQGRKNQRSIEIASDRGKRRSEDRAWATSRHIEYERAMAISLTRAHVADAEDLIDALSTPKPQLGVVA